MDRYYLFTFAVTSEIFHVHFSLNCLCLERNFFRKRCQQDFRVLSLKRTIHIFLL